MRWNRSAFVSSVVLIVAACSKSEAPTHDGASGNDAGAAARAGAGTAGAGAAPNGGAGAGGNAAAVGGAVGNSGGASSAGTTNIPAGGQAGTLAMGGTMNPGGRSGAANQGGTAGDSVTASGGDSSGGAAEGTPTEEGFALLPSVRQEHGVVAANGEIFVLGGYTPDITASVLAYEPAMDTWRSVADFPSPFNHPAAGAVNDKIYVGGFYAGTSLTGPATGQTFVYDPSADTWDERQALPAGTERAGGCVAVVGTMLYVFGGGNSGQATNFASVYDTAADSWTVLPPLPETREHCAAFASGGKLYIAGGRTHTIPEFRPTTLEYDPVAQTYLEKTPIPTPRGGAASAVLDGRLFLFGGEGADNNAGVFPNIEAYDATTDTWEAFPPMLIPRHGFGAGTLDQRTYLPGGATHQGGAASDIDTVFYFE